MHHHFKSEAVGTKTGARKGPTQIHWEISRLTGGPLELYPLLPDLEGAKKHVLL